jgi:hypothetical protein
MNKFLKYQQTMLLLMTFGIAAAVVALYLYFPKTPAYAAGFALGGFAGLVKFRLDVLALLKLSTAPEGSKSHIGNSFRTYVILAATLVTAVYLKEIFHPWAAFGGLLLPRLVLIADGLLRPGLLLQPDEDSGGESDAQTA